jgi:sigma-B regulation protein RsbU (phosphoserine phosphatase)
MRERSPSHSLEILNEALLRQRTDLRFCTVAYALVEARPSGTRVTLASGGHPLPLVLRADGSVEWFGSHGTLMGVVPDPILVDRQTDLGPGDAMVLYTDGVSEARGERGRVNEATLVELLGGCAGLDADEIAARFESAALGVQAGTPRDDIAVVVLRVGDGASERGGRALADVAPGHGYG